MEFSLIWKTFQAGIYYDLLQRKVFTGRIIHIIQRKRQRLQEPAFVRKVQAGRGQLSYAGLGNTSKVRPCDK